MFFCDIEIVEERIKLLLLDGVLDFWSCNYRAPSLISTLASLILSGNDIFLENIDLNMFPSDNSSFWPAELN